MYKSDKNQFIVNETSYNNLKILIGDYLAETNKQFD